jgi:hypothetical protein
MSYRVTGPSHPGLQAAWCRDTTQEHADAAKQPAPPMNETQRKGMARRNITATMQGGCKTGEHQLEIATGRKMEIAPVTIIVVNERPVR